MSSVERIKEGRLAKTKTRNCWSDITRTEHASCENREAKSCRAGSAELLSYDIEGACIVKRIPYKGAYGGGEWHSGPRELIRHLKAREQECVWRGWGGFLYTWRSEVTGQAQQCPCHHKLASSLSPFP